MRNAFHTVFAILIAGLLVCASSRPAAASTVTYTETIEDLSHTTLLDFFDDTRVLRRTRTFGDGTSQAVTSNALIATQNSLSDNWGLSTFGATTWVHQFAPTLAPYGPAPFLHGSLTLDVIGVNPLIFDIVFLEGLPIGLLTPGGFDVETSSLFTTTGLPADFVNSLIAGAVADGQVSVGILPFILDAYTIRASTLEITYEALVNTTTDTSMPEPGTMVLLATGLAAARGWRNRRRRA
jgi:hypothetical protein